jgi:glucokinase
MKEVVAGIDIGGTNTVFGLVEKTGRIIAEDSLMTTDYPEINNYVSALVAAIKRLIETKSGIKLAGIGIGAPNANYHRGTIELAPNLAWKGIVPIAEYIRKKINVPVAITNDAKAAAMDYTAEMLAFGIANAVGFSSPEAVFLFGGLAQAGEVLFGPVREYVDQMVMPIFKGTVKILPSGIPESNAAVLGAAALAWNELK